MAEQNKKNKLKMIKRSLMALLLCVAISPISVYAAEEVPLTITSGLELHEEMKTVGELDLEVVVAEVVEDADGSESILKPQRTFEKTRTVYGEALPGTSVCLWIEVLDEKEEWTLVYGGEVTANSLGMFVFTMPLEEGRNQITLRGALDGYDTITYELQMERISESVKEQLKSLTALPSTIQTNKG